MSYIHIAFYRSERIWHNIYKPYVVVLGILGLQDQVQRALPPFSLFSLLFLLASHPALLISGSGDPLELCVNYKIKINNYYDLY